MDAKFQIASREDAKEEFLDRMNRRVQDDGPIGRIRLPFMTLREIRLETCVRVILPESGNAFSLTKFRMHQEAWNPT